MAFWIAGAAGLVIAYLLGAIPTGYLAGKLLGGIDIREHGSKSTGATNVLRTLGKWPALAVLVIDVLKGAAAIIVARAFCPWLISELSATPPTASDLDIGVPWIVCLAGIAALLGHGRSIWLNFTGGKSAATGLGVLLAMSWPVGLGTAAVFGIVLALSRIVSLSSMLAALTAIIRCLIGCW
jgi:acyl phosphate:glycerol-3-phosphate acyltransferase